MVTEKEFARLVDFIRSEAGIDLSQKRNLVSTRLEKYLQESAYSCLDDYLDCVIRNAAGKEAEQLINVLTTNHTFFWREEQHFVFLEKYILPELKEKCFTRHDLRIWCAAASTWEEPYTLAMVLMDFFGKEHYLWDTTILATDISTKVLNQARLGAYPRESINQLPQVWQSRFFRQEGEMAVVTDELKRQVLFRRLNLMSPFLFHKKLQVVFLRNVLIYFDNETKKKTVDKIVDVIEPGGYLFIGTTESVSKMNDRLEYVMPAVYRVK